MSVACSWLISWITAFPQSSLLPFVTQNDFMMYKQHHMKDEKNCASVSPNRDPSNLSSLQCANDGPVHESEIKRRTGLPYHQGLGRGDCRIWILNGKLGGQAEQMPFYLPCFPSISHVIHQRRRTENSPSLLTLLLEWNVFCPFVAAQNN